MPRKKRTIVEETIPDETPQTTDDDFTDGICVISKVYKISAGGKSFCFQTTEPVDEVTVQEQYPTGGKFVVNEYNTLNQIIRTQHIDIEPKPLASNSSNGNDDLRTRMLMDELNFTRNMMLKMIEGISSNKQNTSTPLGELAQAMQVVHQMAPVGNPVDLIVKGMELGIKSNGGTTDWKAEVVSAVKEVAPAVVTALASNRQIPNQGHQPTMIASNPPESLLKQGIAWLKPQILAGMTTDLAIGWVIQNSSDPMCNQLIGLAIRGNVDTFIQIDPELANEPYRTWFVSAIQLLKEEYAAAQSANQSDNERGNRDDSNTTDDEIVSVGKSKIVKVS
jgi:hypothetical protein